MWRHQRQAVEKALRNGHLGVFVPPGGGKTRIALESIRHWGLPALVIAPSHAGHVWQENAQKFWPDVRVRVLTRGSRDKRVEQLMACRGIAVVNYEAVWTLRTALRERSWAAVVLDECQAIASPNAKRTQAIQHYLGGVKHRMVLSAWPTHKRLQHLFCPMRFVDGGERLGRRASDFRMRYMQMHPSGFGWEPQPGAERRVASRIADVTFVLQEDELAERIDVPEILPNPVRVELSGPTGEAYTQACRDWMAGDRDLQSASERATRMLQATAGLVDDAEVFDPANPKTRVLLDLLDEWGNEERVVVYGWFRREVRGVSEAVRAAGRPSWSIHGGDDVPAVLAVWKNTPGGVLVVQAGMGTGWEATEARHVVFHSRPFTASTYHQCVHRVARVHQKRKVLVTDLIAEGTLDEKFYQALREERDFIDLVRALVAEAATQVVVQQ